MNHLGTPSRPVAKLDGSVATSGFRASKQSSEEPTLSGSKIDQRREFVVALEPIALDSRDLSVTRKVPPQLTVLLPASQVVPFFCCLLFLFVVFVCLLLFFGGGRFTETSAAKVG